MLTWSEFDRAATNLAHRLLALGVAPGDGVAVWHKDTSAIHVLLVAIERCGAVAVGLGARAGVREVTAILRTARPTLVVTDVERLAPAQQAAADADPALRVVALGDGSADLCIDTTPRPDGTRRPVTRGARRRLPDQLHVGHHRTAQMRCPHPEPVALLPPEGRRQRRTHSGRCVPPGDPHAVRLRYLDLAHHADSPGCHGGQDRAVRPRRHLRGHRAPPGDGAVLRQHAVGDDPGQSGLAGLRPDQPAGGVHRRRAAPLHPGGPVRGADRRHDPAVLRFQRDRDAERDHPRGPACTAGFARPAGSCRRCRCGCSTGIATSRNRGADNPRAAALRSVSGTWVAPTTTSCSRRTAGCGWATSANSTPTATSP